MGEMSCLQGGTDPKIVIDALCYATPHVGFIDMNHHDVPR